MKGTKIKKFAGGMLASLCAAAVILGAADAALPDSITLRADDSARISALLGDSAAEAFSGTQSTDGDIYRTEGTIKLLGSIPVKKASVSVVGDVELIPGGVPFGVKIYSEGVSVAGLGDVTCGGNIRCPAKEAGIMERDVILSVNGTAVNEAALLSRLIDESGGKTVKLCVRRGDKEFTAHVSPVLCDSDGKYKAGLLIKDGTAGIGTVTYIDPDSGSFAGLGHGICEADSGKPVPLSRGMVVNVELSGIVKGQAGIPGELKGYFSSGKIGSVFRNTDRGIYGVFANYPAGVESATLPVALSREIKEGEAKLRCTVDGEGICEYTVNISDIDRAGRAVKNFVVTVTDEALISKTGGIVQGMSGSPIIQDGKLIGALTHVLINNPQKGYGIFIENMLDAAA